MDLRQVENDTDTGGPAIADIERRVLVRSDRPTKWVSDERTPSFAPLLEGADEKTGRPAARVCLDSSSYEQSVTRV